MQGQAGFAGAGLANERDSARAVAKPALQAAHVIVPADGQRGRHGQGRDATNRLGGVRNSAWNSGALHDFSSCADKMFAWENISDSMFRKCRVLREIRRQTVP
jgi:hypothetical protein